MPSTVRPLALITGASSGIGYELARQFVEHDYDVLIAADGAARLEEAAEGLRAASAGGEVIVCVTDLSSPEGVEALHEAARALARPVDVLCANVGVGMGHAFHEQDLADILRIINVNVSSTVHLVWLVLQDMVSRGQGRVLITSSLVALIPGSFQAVYTATKAFLHNFAFAIRNELKDTGVTVTALMPGATETEFFAKADMLETRIGRSHKADPADVARAGFEALLRGDGDVVVGALNKAQAAVAAVSPDSLLAEMHRKQAEPRGGET